MQIIDPKNDANGVKLEAVFGAAIQALKRVSKLVSGRSNCEAELCEIQQHLNALPLPSYVFAIASNRLENVRRYLTDAEFGAAHWELRALQACLSGLADCNEPKRRMRK